MARLDLTDPADKWLPDVADDASLAQLIAIVQRRMAADQARLNLFLALQGLRAANSPPPPAPTTA